MANRFQSYEQPYEYIGDGKTEEKKPEAPKKKAVALLYDPEDQAPKVVAAGKGQVAEHIIEKAKASDVPTYVDKGLTDTLMHLDVGDYIPPELYGVVAEILIYVDKMDKIKSKVRPR